MNLYISKDEEDEISVHARSPKEPFKELRIENFCIMISAGVGTPDQIFCDVFKPPVDVSRRFVKLAARALAQRKSIARRAHLLRKGFIAQLSENLVMQKFEAIDIITQRLRDDSTHSRDIVPLVAKLGELLNWDKENEVSDDPIATLLAKVESRRMLPNES